MAKSKASRSPNRLKENVRLFRSIKKLSSQDRRLILHYLNDDGVMRFCELILNILKGRVQLSNKELASLKKYKGLLRFFINRSRAISKKRALLSQKGGLVGALLSIGASLLPTIIDQVVKATK